MTSSASSSADITRDARLLRMTDLRQFDTTLVDDLLRGSDPARRARATLAIGQVKGRARYAQLRRLLVDPDTAVAANAAFALGLARDTSSIIVLARAVAGAPDVVATAAAWSLGDIGAQARNVLTFALGEGIAQPLTASTAAQRSPAVRAALLIATSKVRGVPASVLIPWLNDPDATVVRATAYTFGRTRAQGGVRGMLALQKSADEETRQHVAKILARNITGDSLASRALEALQILISDPSALVRVNAVRSLATFGAPAREAVLRAAHDADGNVRVATSEIVGPFLGSDVAAWKRAWDSDSTLPVRINLIAAARRAGINALYDAETHWISAADWRERAAVLRARVDSLHPPKLGDVAWGLVDKDPRVREAAVNATRAVARNEPALSDSIRLLWKHLLSDRDVQTRANVLTVMRGAGRSTELAAALDAYSASANDRENDARVAALAFISTVWQRDSARVAPEIRQRLLALRVPADSAELTAGRAIPLLTPWRTARVTGSSRPLSDYETIVRKYVVGDARPVRATIRTERGNISLVLNGHDAPLTVDNFVQLARRGLYSNTNFHRVVPNFVAQDGDPRGDGTGGPGYSIRDELTRNMHGRGSLAMATSGPDTAGSQYYLCHAAQPHLDGHYVVFGQISDGYEVLDRIVQGDRVLSIEVH